MRHRAFKNIHAKLKPYTWYVEHVVAGAEEAGLPAEYINNLKGVESVIDPDPEREKKELAIYQSSDRITMTRVTAVRKTIPERPLESSD